VIDLHAHVVLEATLGAAGIHGPELDEGDEATGRPPRFRAGDYTLVGVRYRDTPFMDLARRLEAMDAAGIELQVLSPNPLTFFSHLDAEEAVRFCRRHNDELAALVARAPDRLRGFAQLPMQDPAAAIAELTRAVRQLGLVAPYVGTDVGRPLDDPALDEVWGACTELDVPVFVHPAPDGACGPRRDERLARFDADLWLGFLYEETLAVASLVLGGVLERHPALDVCVSHGGGATAWLAERIEHAARTRPWGAGAIAEPGFVARGFERLWWDAHVGGARALVMLIDAFGADRVVGGTNMAGWDQTTDPAYGDAALGARMDQNARRLLRLPTS
jgi:aminocarboxymuconate-semialdehyde decarboxylase